MTRIIGPLLAVTIVLAALILVSNAGGVPQAVTKAPGEANHNSCATCHTPAGNYVPSVKLDVMTTDSTVVTSYEPGQTYIVRLKVSGTNSPKSYGFQMTCLDSLTNADQGLWSQLGPSVKQQNLTVLQKPRKYLVQSSPRANGTFTARWTAPATDLGKIKFYYTGLAVNLNGNTNGDNNITGQLTLKSPGTTASEDFLNTSVVLYPNPVSDILNISGGYTGSLVAYGASSGIKYTLLAEGGKADVRHLPAGMYTVVPVKDINTSGKHFRILKL